MNVRDRLVLDISSITEIQTIHDSLNVTGLSNINNTLSIHYLIYEMINKVNNKYYIGQHYTKDPLDNYSGSGYYLNDEIHKYGLSNFVKVILCDYPTFNEMDQTERESVQLSDCYPENNMSYNLKEGGSNGPHTDEIKKKLGDLSRKMWMGKTKEEKYIMMKPLRDGWLRKCKSEGFKDPFRNKTQEERDEINKKKSVKYFSKSIQERKRISDKKVESYNSRSDEQKRLTKIKHKQYYDNLSPQEKQKLNERLQKNMKSFWDKPENHERIKRMNEERRKNPEWVKMRSLSQSGENNGCYGKKRIYDPFKQKYKYVKPEEIEQYLSKGYLRNKPNP